MAVGASSCLDVGRHTDRVASWLIVLLAVLGTARLTRLITRDAITEPARAWITGRLPLDSRLVYFIHCDWCASIYVGAGVAAAVWTWPHRGWVDIPLIALTGSYVAGWSARLEDKADAPSPQ